MAIRDVIRTLCSADDGRLVQVEPLLPESRQRVICATRGLHDEIEAGAVEKSGSLAHRVGQLRYDFDHFSTGGPITVGYGSERTCMLKRLEPQSEEVWELRRRAPKPALRVFGRFAAPDVFIAPHMVRRDDLGGWGSLEWAAEIRTCKAIWRQLFHTFPPPSEIGRAHV